MQGLLRTCVSLLTGTLIAALITTRISLIALIRQLLLLLGELLRPCGLLHRIHLEWQHSTNLPAILPMLLPSP